MSLLAHFALMFCAGAVFGAIHAYSTRLLVALWFGLIAIYIVSHFYSVAATGSPPDLDAIKLVVGIVAFVVGEFAGGFMYRRAVAE